MIHFPEIVLSCVLMIGCFYPEAALSQVTFTDVTETAKVGNSARGMGAAWGITTTTACLTFMYQIIKIKISSTRITVVASFPMSRMQPMWETPMQALILPGAIITTMVSSICF